MNGHDDKSSKYMRGHIEEEACEQVYSGRVKVRANTCTRVGKNNLYPPLTRAAL